MTSPQHSRSSPRRRGITRPSDLSIRPDHASDSGRRPRHDPHRQRRRGWRLAQVDAEHPAVSTREVMADPPVPPPRPGSSAARTPGARAGSLAPWIAGHRGASHGTPQRHPAGRQRRRVDLARAVRPRHHKRSTPGRSTARSRSPAPPRGPRRRAPSSGVDPVAMTRREHHHRVSFDLHAGPRPAAAVVLVEQPQQLLGHRLRRQPGDRPRAGERRHARVDPEHPAARPPPTAPPASPPAPRGRRHLLHAIFCARQRQLDPLRDPRSSPWAASQSSSSCSPADRRSPPRELELAERLHADRDRRPVVVTNSCPVT